MSPLLMESFLKLSQTIAGPDINAKECKSWNWLFAAPGQPVRGQFGVGWRSGVKCGDHPPMDPAGRQT